ncbi:hypothetical protein [Hymenobacter koreensis]|uniref:Uncharacterized protein n=1 Tax=Hymenobacter koreensis TaxID=1084523 RepID=A0ABP8JN35_9BACT
MIPRTIYTAVLDYQLRPDTLTDYLRRSATPAERAAYNAATAPGQPKAGYPRTVQALKSLAAALPA